MLLLVRFHGFILHFTVVLVCMFVHCFFLLWLLYIIIFCECGRIFMVLCYCLFGFFLFNFRKFLYFKNYYKKIKLRLPSDWLVVANNNFLKRFCNQKVVKFLAEIPFGTKTLWPSSSVANFLQPKVCECLSQSCVCDRCWSWTSSLRPGFSDR